MKARGVKSIGAVIALLVSLIVGAGTAQAAGPSYRSCTKDGFVGEVRFWYTHNGSYVNYVGRVEYRITNNGRDNANLDWWDDDRYEGLIGDDGIQDGNWHEITSAANGGIGDYNRQGKQEVKVIIIFDKAWLDPWCEIKWTM